MDSAPDGSDQKVDGIYHNIPLGELIGFDSRSTLANQFGVAAEYRLEVEVSRFDAKNGTFDLTKTFHTPERVVPGNTTVFDHPWVNNEVIKFDKRDGGTQIGPVVISINVVLQERIGGKGRWFSVDAGRYLFTQLPPPQGGGGNEGGGQLPD